MFSRLSFAGYRQIGEECRTFSIVWRRHLLHGVAYRNNVDATMHPAALQVGDKLYAQLPGAAGMIASPVVAIENVIEHSAYNLQTLRGEGIHQCQTVHCILACSNDVKCASQRPKESADDCLISSFTASLGRPSSSVLCPCRQFHRAEYCSRAVWHGAAPAHLG